LIADDIVAAARECVGTPFRHQGRVIGLAMDCAGVVVHAVRSCGIEVYDVSGYGPTPNKGLLELALEQHIYLSVVQPGERRAGDILLMRFVSEPQHLAIATATGIIHAYEAARKCCEHDIDALWASRIVRVYRVVEQA
jgi:cell wall-associated NlpC family hydrolase